MKKFFQKFGGMIATVAIAVASANVNSACLFIMHQAPLPKEAKKLRKF